MTLQDREPAKPTFSGPQLCALGAVETVGLLRKREISPLELVEAALSRIASVEPLVNAMPTLCADRARAAAEAIAAGPGGETVLLAGLPVGIKDLTPVAGVRTTFGTPGLADFVPEESDMLVERLEQRGAVVLGKTNTPELGAGGNTFNPVFGPTFNPWDTRLNAGGSSGGATAALATGETWLSHGSDHGGSLRTPSAYCGVVGLRPGFGRVPGGGLDNVFMLEGAQGPMARSVADCALFLDAMAGHDQRYPLSLPSTGPSFLESAERAADLRRPRLAFAPDLGGLSPVDAEMAAHLAGAVAMLARDGFDVEEACPDIAGLEQTYHVLRGMMWSAAARRMPPEVTRHFKPTLARNVAFGDTLTMERIADALLDRSRIYQAMVRFFERHDVLACPVVGCMPHPQGEEWVAEIGGVRLEGYMDWLRFAFLATVTGLPAMSVPVGLGPRGLPVGLQLIGKPQGEAELLAIAQRVEWSMGGPLGPIDPSPRKG